MYKVSGILKFHLSSNMPKNNSKIKFKNVPAIYTSKVWKHALFYYK